jgi:hypothetical protein
MTMLLMALVLLAGLAYLPVVFASMSTWQLFQHLCAYVSPGSPQCIFSATTSNHETTATISSAAAANNSVLYYKSQRSCMSGATTTTTAGRSASRRSITLFCFSLPEPDYGLEIDDGHPCLECRLTGDNSRMISLPKTSVTHNLHDLFI